MQDLDILDTLIKKGDSLLGMMKEVGFAPRDKKELTRLWNAKELADVLGKGRDTVARAAAKLIEEGTMAPFSDEQKHPTTGAVLGYTLNQVNTLRKHYNINPGRKDDMIDEPLILAFQSFKGGVAKTMTTVHAAQYMASKGYRVLVVDMDPQASLTNLFGYNADKDIDDECTVAPFFEGDQPDLTYAVRPTYWENLDLIPSNLTTNGIELQLFFEVQNAQSDEGKKELLASKLRFGLDSVKHNYDVVMLDCPPALGLLTINILGSADAVVIPTPPSQLDFSSTQQYLKMLRDLINKVDGAKTYKFFKLLCTKVQPNQSAQLEFAKAMRSIYGDSIIPETFPIMAEVDKAANKFRTILEDRRPDKKALSIIEAFCKQIELECLKTWPSKAVEVAYLEKELKEKELEHV